MKEYAIAKSDHLKEYFRQYYQENKEKIIRQVLERKRNFPAQARASRRKMKKKKYATNIQFALKERLRSRLSSALRRYEVRPVKSDHTLVLIGCPIEDLKTYLENRFKPGMSWGNRDKWQIDHVRPCASFDLTQESQQKECFHYSNLQPLWSEENRIKGAKLSQAFNGLGKPKG